MAGDSGGYAAETPVGRTLRWEHAGLSGVGLLEAVRVLGGNPSLGPQIRGDLARTGQRECKLKLDHVLGHVLHGSKPQITHQIRRSIRKAILGFFFGNFRISWGNHKLRSNPWQPKVADTR